MTDPVGIYLTVLFIGIVLTIIVGQILVRSGRPFLEDVFAERETADSVTRLLVVLFHLVVLGVIALVATIDITLDHPIQTIVVRLGLVLLVLGAAYAGSLFVLARLRSRRQTQMLLDEQSAQAEQARQAWAQQYGQPGVDPSHTHPHTHPPAAQTYPVIEPGPGR
ncbi:MAG: hypothetical protein ACRDSL_16610 [Pseudonocardiaceae bacterium]